METKVGLKPNQRSENSVKEAWWKRGIQQSIHIKILKKKKRGKIKNKEKYKVIQHIYRVNKKELTLKRLGVNFIPPLWFSKNMFSREK